MRFTILERDVLARIAEIELDGHTVRTPTIAFADAKVVKAPKGTFRLSRRSEGGSHALVVAPSAFAHEDDRDAGQHLFPGARGSIYAAPAPDAGFIVPDSMSSLLLDSRKFVGFVADAKAGERLLKPVFCPVAGLPHRLAALAYCGFDVFDSLPLIMSAESGAYLTSTGVHAYDEIDELPCSCDACADGARDRERLYMHNCTVAVDELKLVRHAIARGALRELVEARVRSDPWLVQNLRLLDIHHYELQEMHTAVKGRPFHAGSKESLSRPDIVRWRRRLQERYARPKSARVLVLLPCSARKPYSISQSHRRFRQAVRASGVGDVVHEVIVTSPLGLVPRELELFYPAKDYDIPVTGHWDRDERKMVEDMVSWLGQSQRYDLVVSHLGDERDIVNSVLSDFVDTSMGEPGSRGSLARLEEALREHAPKDAQGSLTAREVEDMRSRCRFQFGAPGDALCEGAKVTGRWPNLRIVRGNIQMGMLTGDRGMISLTLEGARSLAPSGAYCVEIDDFFPKGNLFAVGVERAAPEVRIGDDVAVVFKGETRAVGVARMCAKEMALADRCEAVHVRHAVHA